MQTGGTAMRAWLAAGKKREGSWPIPPNTLEDFLLPLLCFAESFAVVFLSSLSLVFLSIDVVVVVVVIVIITVIIGSWQDVQRGHAQLVVHSCSEFPLWNISLSAFWICFCTRVTAVFPVDQSCA